MAYRPTVSPDFVDVGDMRVWVQRELERISSELSEVDVVIEEGGGGGIEEAPNDGQQYARESLGWQVVEGVPGPPGPPGDPGDITDVGLDNLEQGIRDYVENQLSTAILDTSWIEQLIASKAAEQDAHNWLEKIRWKEADVTQREQVSAQFGLKWRGDWEEFTQYFPQDQVRFEGNYYWTPDHVISVPPGQAPWLLLLNVATISEGWRSFAGDDGVAAQTSSKLEARFTGTQPDGTVNDLPMSVSRIMSEWTAFAGPDFAAAQTSEEIQSSFNTTNDAVATVKSQWETFAGTDGAAAASSNLIEARFKGGTVGTTLNDMETSVAKIMNEWRVFVGSTYAAAQSEATTIAAIGTNSAAIDVVSQAAATIDGKLLATWQITANVNNYITGIKLYNTGAASGIVFTTDTFTVATPGVAGPTAVFQIGTRGGLGKVVLRGDMIIDGAVIAQTIAANVIEANHLRTDVVVVTGTAQIANLIVDTVKIADAAVSNFATGAGGSFAINVYGQVNVIVTNISFRGYPGAAVLVNVSGSFEFVAVTSEVTAAIYRVWINEVEAASQTVNFRSEQGQFQYQVVPITGSLNIGASGAVQTVPVRITVEKIAGLTANQLSAGASRIIVQSFAR